MIPNQGLLASAGPRRRCSAAISTFAFFGSLIWSVSAWQVRAAEDTAPLPEASEASPAATAPPCAVAPPVSHAETTQFKHGEWPFQPLARPAVPEIKKLSVWARNAVDAFIGEKLEAAGIEPSPEADKLTLLRRVTFDLTGLPPTPAEQAAFLADRSASAYAKVVDRLLASPRYGERWAQHWLDLVRYSESEGFKHDYVRPDAHKYRDYVIRALNDDMPYDRFVRQQIAGDELEPDHPDALIATGFIRLYPDEINASNLVQRRQEILDDITDNVGLAFLGMTMGCARCHDHKYDAITQVDYYRLQACFAAILPNDDAPVAPKDEVAEYQKQLAKWQEATKTIRDDIDRMLANERQEVMQEVLSAYDPQTIAAIKMPALRRNCFQKQLAAEADEWIETRLDRAHRRCSEEERKLYDQRIEELTKFDHLKPRPLPTAMAVSDGDDQAPVTCLLANGNYLKPKQEVTPGFPGFLGASEPEITPPAHHPESTGRRSALAKWLTRPDHPLTARVIVNRLWQHHFGQGIVATTNDFGAMGGSPSHQELLDWLASELVAGGWRMKPVHRLMVLSATYCQSSRINPSSATHIAAQAADAANNLLWHARRQRLEGEALRDAMLQASGQINFRMYGTSAHPELPAALTDSRYSWEPDQQLADRNRRSIYVLARRNLRLPLFEAFDQPDMQNSCSRRSTTTTAPQALELLNGNATEEVARHWSGKLISEFGDDEDRIVRAAYAQAFGRTPHAAELKAAEEFVDRQTALLAEEKTPPDDRQLPLPMPAKIARTKAAAIVDFCHAVLCSNEFLYVD